MSVYGIFIYIWLKFMVNVGNIPLNGPVMRHRGIAIVCQVQVTAVQPFDFFRTIRQADFFCLAFAGWWLLGKGGG